MNERIKYYLLIGLLSSFFLVELIVGLISNSLSLQTDSFHMLSDIIALIIGLICYNLTKKEATDTHTYGWVRAEIIGALANSVFLLAIILGLLIESVQKIIILSDRLENPELESNIDTVLIVGVSGLIVNIVGIKLFHSHSHDHNSKAVMLHIIGDFLGSIVVIVNTLLIKFVSGKWRLFLDPISTLFLISFIIYSSIKILRETITILLQTNYLEYQKIIKEIKSVDNILDVHEFHTWALNSHIFIASLHVRVHSRKNVKKTLKQVKEILHRYKIHSSSVQIEHEECPEPNCETVCQEHRCCKN